MLEGQKLQATLPPPQRLPVPLSKSLSVVHFAVHKTINAFRVQSLENTEDIEAEMLLMHVQPVDSCVCWEHFTFNLIRYTLQKSIQGFSCYYCGNEPVKMTQVLLIMVYQTKHE